MAFKDELKRRIRSYAKLFYFENVAAKAVAVHAAVQEGAANAFPGPFTSPAIPRSLEIVFAAGWQGGDITINGLDQFSAPITEVIPDTPGSTVAGVKVFKTVVSASKELVAGTTDTATLQTGAKIGIPATIAHAYGILHLAGVTEAVVLDTTYHAFTPTTAPNGTNDYTLMVNCNHVRIPAS